MQKAGTNVEAKRERERRAEEKAGLITIKPLDLGTMDADAAPAKKPGGFKMAFGGSSTTDSAEKKSSGFKKAFGKVDEVATPIEALPAAVDLVGKDGFESDTDEEYEHYDPAHPTN